MPTGRRLALGLAESLESVEFTVDDVARETGEPTAAVLARLLQLELAGRNSAHWIARFLRVRSRMLT